MRVVLLFLVLFFSQFDLSGSEQEKFSIDVSLSSNEIAFEDQLTIFLTLHYPSTHQVDLEALRSNIIDDEVLLKESFAIIDEEIESPQESDGQMMQNIRYQLDPTFSGRHPISFMSVQFSSFDSDEVVEIFSDFYQVRVLQPDESPIEVLTAASLLSLDSKPTIRMDARNRSQIFENSEREKLEVLRNLAVFERSRNFWGWIIACSTMLVFTCFGAYLFKRGFLNKGRGEPSSEDPKSKALKALEALLSLQLPGKKEFETFYVQLTGIVRVYVEEEFHLKAPERTTEEFLRELSGSSYFDMETTILLEEFLTYADLVKFARFSPDVKECVKAGESAETFVNHSSYITSESKS
ncbi:MAG: hypothetical protein ACI9S8_000263 [Chlamydiales bacterium]|jgi:hypothetical protein